MQNKLIVETVDELVILKNIPTELDLSGLMTRLSFQIDIASHKGEITRLVEQVVSLARPEAVFKSSRVNDKTANALKIDGLKFNNALLRVNLKQVEQVFPYVVTCGQKMDSFMPSNNLGDAELIVREMVLAEAENYLQSYITNRYNLDFLWSLQPGNMQAWPAAERIPLFSLLGKVEELIGVRLSENGTLKPKFSACGIFYYDTQMEFEGCQVCPQEPCMGRRAPYSQELDRKYAHRARRRCGSRS
jgi:hypothetical protein